MPAIARRGPTCDELAEHLFGLFAVSVGERDVAAESQFARAAILGVGSAVLLHPPLCELCIAVCERRIR
jgi:hypothetical protein